MSNSERFRFGRIYLPDDQLPTPQELYESIDNKFTKRDTEPDEESDGERVYMEKGRSAQINDEHDEYGYCHFYYVADTESSVVIREGDEEVETSQRELVRPRILYFDTGEFAYEARNDLRKHWVPKFIAERTDTQMSVDDYSFANKFDQDVMGYYYDWWDSITVFRFGAPEDGDGFESDSPLANALNELTQDIDNQQFSGGQSQNNLKDTNIVREAREYMNILKLHGKQEDGYTMNILSSGTFKSAWSEKDWNNEGDNSRQAETIRETLIPLLNRIQY